MAVCRLLKGTSQIAADFQAVYRLRFNSTNRRICAVPDLGLKPHVCHYTTEFVASKKLNKAKRNHAIRENDPDQFGGLKDSFIEPSRLLKRNLYKEKEAQKSVSRLKQGNKLPSKTRNCEGEQNEADVFGATGPPIRTSTADLPTDDEGDKLEEKYHQRIRPKPWQTLEYFTGLMKEHIQERRLDSALALFKEIKQTYRIEFDAHIFDILIGGCGRVGYTEMAFNLYKEMKERNIKPRGPIYTGLFNACANSPFPENGLRCATGFYNKITEKGISLNAKTYHAAIKAFGRCGDLQMAFHLVDEMVAKGVGVTTETFNFLLSGCASDRDSGFLQAIRVWRKMKTKGLQSDCYSYNLLLRVVRDCGMGDPQVAMQLLFNGNTLENLDRKRLATPVDHNENEIPTTTLSVMEAQLPDILLPSVRPCNVVDLQAADTASKRLLMLGGIDGIFRRMKKDKVQPLVKTFMELLEIIPGDEEQEVALMAVMSKKKVRPDVDFFNILIKRRNTRHNFESAKQVLQLIAKNSLHVDIATFGTLAIGCHQWKDAKVLLHDMEEAGFRPNIIIMGALARNACNTKNFWYLIDVLKTIQEKEIQAGPRLIEELEATIISTKKYIVEKEEQGAKFEKDDKFIKNFKIFIMYYNKWLQTMKIDLPGHPWEAYGHEAAK